MRHNEGVRITVGDIHGNATDFESLARLHVLGYAYSLLGGPVVLDLSSVRWLEAPMCATLGAVIEDLRETNTVQLLWPRREAVRRLLQRNGFAAAFGGRRLPDFYQSTLGYERQAIDDEGATVAYVRERLLARNEMTAYSSQVRLQIEQAFAELRENSREHGRSHDLFVCGQLFPQLHKLVIQVVDRGIGFNECINTARGTRWDDKRCLEWAMAEGSTTRSGDRPGGLGLKELRRFLTETGGAMRIVSGAASWSLDSGHVDSVPLRHRLPVTAVTVRFSTNALEPPSLSEPTVEEDYF